MAQLSPASRPLSPHLSIYRFTWLMAASIIHRLTGAALYFGMALVAWWLLALARGPEAYGLFLLVASSWPGRLVLFGYAWALMHHMLGGIRHLVWDTGEALDVKTARVLAIANFIGSFALTLLICVTAAGVR